MSKRERENPDILSSYEEPKSDKKGRNVVVIITIPTALIITLVVLWFKYRTHEVSTECDCLAYLSQVDQSINERVLSLPDTTQEYINNKFVLDYKRSAIDLYSPEKIKKNWENLRTDLLRIADERNIVLPVLPDACAQ